MATIEPKLYLDTNIIMDIVHDRWMPSVQLADRIRKEKNLYMLDRRFVQAVMYYWSKNKS